MPRLTDSIIVGNTYGHYKVIGRGEQHPEQPTKVRSVMVVDLRTHELKEFSYYKWRQEIATSAEPFLYIVVNLTHELVTHAYYPELQDASTLLAPHISGLVLLQEREGPTVIAYRQL